FPTRRSSDLKYKIIGTFDKRIAIDEVGDKNGIEFLVEGAELFGYTFYADNKTIFICDDDTSHKVTDVELIGGYNVDEANVSINTQEQKTYIRGFGKKKTKSETKNYNPIKPPNLTYTVHLLKKVLGIQKELETHLRNRLTVNGVTKH